MTKLTKRTTLINNFHNTEVTVNALPGDLLSKHQVRRIKRTLCGIKDCSCGTCRGGKYGVREFDSGKFKLTYIECNSL